MKFKDFTHKGVFDIDCPELTETESMTLYIQVDKNTESPQAIIEIVEMDIYGEIEVYHREMLIQSKDDEEYIQFNFDDIQQDIYAKDCLNLLDHVKKLHEAFLKELSNDLER